MRLRGRHYSSGERVDVVLDNGIIASIEPATVSPADAEAGWIGPALFDLQVNGCDGHSFNSDKLTTENVRHVVDVCRHHGIAGLCPTLVTGSFEALAHGLATLRQACEQDPVVDRAVPGIHVEGPYISSEDGPRGAHPRQHVRPPSWDEFRRWQDAAGGKIRLMTVAPELPGAIPFIEKLVANNVVVAVGHTAAKRDAIQAAIAAGARLSTHLGNGSHALLPRHDNYIWDQLAEDDLWASIITDGHHLPPSLVKSFLRIKTPARTILTCDSGTLAGCPPGRYKQWDQDFEVTSSGKIVVAESGFLAGSWAFTDLCVENVLKFAEVTLEQAIDMASAHPRKLLGFEPWYLLPGTPAKILLFDWSPKGAFKASGVF